MFELKKFKKNYPLLTEFISDKKKMKKLLEDKTLLEFYIKEDKSLEKFINNLKLIYNLEKVENIVMDIINNKKFEKFKIDSYNLNQYIQWYKSYNGSLESIEQIDWKIIENNRRQFNGYEIEQITLDICFIKKYKETIYINNHDIKDIFLKTDSLVTKRKLYSLLKNNNLDFFAFIINELSKYNVNIENLDDIFKEEIYDGIYNREIRKNLSEKEFLKLIIYFFDHASSKEKIIINKLIEANNYELISDILHMKGQRKFSVKENEVDKDIFSISEIGSYSISGIILNILSPVEKVDIEYLNNLGYSIDKDAYDAFYEKHKEVIDLSTKLYYENFTKLTLEEQKSIYKYVKSLSLDKKNMLVEEIKQINIELRILYKNEYLDVISNSNTIINKSENKTITDSLEKEHSVRVYELKDEEPFTFLITVMHNKARDQFLNMYGRPAHKLTINDPSNFCKDLEGGSEIISTSMINEKFIDTFVGPYADVMYIFSDLESEDILSVCHEDAAFPPKIEENIDLFLKNRPVGPRELMRETIRNNDYNEIAIRRKRLNGTRIIPTAILCYDEINDISIKHAEYFNIPIVVIKTKTYEHLQHYTDRKEKTSGIRK